MRVHVGKQIGWGVVYHDLQKRLLYTMFLESTGDKATPNCILVIVPLATKIYSMRAGGSFLLFITEVVRDRK